MSAVNMTDDLYQHYATKARQQGAQYAVSIPGRDAPLSGEWAGEWTPQDVYRAIGIDDDMQELLYESPEGAESLNELTDQFETAYFENDPCLCPKWPEPFDYDGPEEYASTARALHQCTVHPDN